MSGDVYTQYLFLRTPHRIAAAAFSGVPARFRKRACSLPNRGLVLSTPALLTVSVRPVSTPPGHTRLTPMRCWARSKRSTSETPRRPNLLAEYAACHGIPMIPAADDTLT